MKKHSGLIFGITFGVTSGTLLGVFIHPILFVLCPIGAIIGVLTDYKKQ